MGRPKAFSDHQFIKSMPSNPSEAITEKEVMERVGCKRATANNWLRQNLQSGMVVNGKPTFNGALTYHLVSARPDNWLPRFADAKEGKMFDIKVWLVGVALKKEKLDDKNRVILLAVMRLWQGALNDDESLAEVNQEVRIALQKERSALAGRLRMFDSFLQEPFLSGNNEDVSMAEDAMRAVSGDISLEELNDKYNALRTL